MSIEARKINLVQHILGDISEIKLSKIEDILNGNDDLLKSKLIQRAIQSNNDIKEGNVYTLDQVQAKLNKHFSK